MHERKTIGKTIARTKNETKNGKIEKTDFVHFLCLKMNELKLVLKFLFILYKSLSKAL